MMGASACSVFMAAVQKKGALPSTPFLVGPCSRSMAHARAVAIGQHTHPIATAKWLVRFLHEGDHAPAVEAHRNFHAVASGGIVLDRSAGDAADDRAYHGADRIGPRASTHGAAGDTADRRTGERAYARLGAFDIHRTYAFDYAHLHRLRAHG